MGNEASLEGGEGWAGLPEGVAGAAAADGGSPRQQQQQQGPPSGAAGPGGVAAELSRLSDDERRQIAAVVSRAQQGMPEGDAAAERLPQQRHAEAGVGWGGGAAGARRGVSGWGALALPGPP
ncbi:protein piccolo-like [Lacerta agilis]|uniref:protein piccolo-like n=1 Tax=Lacerta agilis TaxID=80427 RepID=UPI00141A6006|nr:protein piccolo-like [Lacerta agilis]